MQNNVTKRKVFWFLKRNSSLTLWRHLRSVYQPFFDAIEEMVKKHPKNSPNYIQLNLYRYSLDNKINFQKGIALLEIGDRSVFKQNEEGFLYHTSSAAIYILMLLHRGDCPDSLNYLGDLAEIGENESTGAGTPFEQAKGEPAPWYTRYLFLPSNHPTYSLPSNPPPVPEAVEPPIHIKTGEEVPVDGIYEPEGEGTCMNYLLGGTIAPMVIHEFGELKPSTLRKGTWIRSTECIPTTWRLIWADHRYEDGTVPEEEKDYFLPLEKEEVPQEEITNKKRALPGESCTRPGYWWTPAKQDSRRYFKEGEIFPDFQNSSYGATIWQYEEEG